MGIFKRKSEGAGSDIPLEQVTAMKGQGYSNNQMIQTLQRDGYTSSQIFDAISQAEMTSSSPVSTIPSNTPAGMMDMSQAPISGPQGMGGQESFGQPMMQGPMPQFAESSNTEEMIEAIIDEKWNELVRDINKVIEWKQKADVKLGNMEQQMSDLKDQFDKLHQAIIGKIGEYDKHMLDVGAELQAMEKVFSKVLPSFVDNVNELNRITERIKTAPAAVPRDQKKKSDRQ
jgi:hypothetical protein